jgi:hypothetical protein
MFRFRIALFFVVLLVLVAACGGRASPAAAPTAAPASDKIVERVATQVVEKVVVAPAAGPEPAQADAVAQAGEISDVRTSPYQAGRLILKDGQMDLLVEDTDRAIDQITQIAVDSGGYVLSSESQLRDAYKVATLKLGVPSEQFEDVQRRVRALAVRVLNETASGQDVSDEYVDLQSRLTNLEATAARIREFLAQAKTVEEALKVNAELSNVEDEIEKIKGRMNYLKDRAAYSTLTIGLEPVQPTPTPTPTATVTPTATPAAWRPGETLKSATGVLGSALRGLVELLIWLAVVVLPFVLVFGLIAWLVRWLVRRRKR